jgi:hypothetical protein
MGKKLRVYWGSGAALNGRSHKAWLVRALGRDEVNYDLRRLALIGVFSGEVAALSFFRCSPLARAAGTTIDLRPIFESVRSGKKISADHLQTIAPGLIAYQHNGNPHEGFLDESR